MYERQDGFLKEVGFVEVEWIQLAQDGFPRAR
jgi:hypothetical protein